MINKPEKYELKLFLFFDYLTKYTLTGMFYIGRQRNQKNVGLSSDIKKFLLKALHFSVVN